MPKPSVARSNNNAAPTADQSDADQSDFVTREFARRTYAGETFAERLHRLRSAAGLSQREIAGQCERVSYAYISRLEAGRRLASVRAIRELAAALGVTAAYLEFGYEHDTEKAELQRVIDRLRDQLATTQQAQAAAEDRADRYAQQLRDHERKGPL